MNIGPIQESKPRCASCSGAGCTLCAETAGNHSDPCIPCPACNPSGSVLERVVAGPGAAVSLQDTAAALGVYFTSTRPERSATHAWQEAPFSDPWYGGTSVLTGGRSGPAYPIGSTDLGPVDPLEVYRARLRNQVPFAQYVHLTRPATDDEILAALHGLPLNLPSTGLMIMRPA